MKKTLLTEALDLNREWNELLKSIDFITTNSYQDEEKVLRKREDKLSQKLIDPLKRHNQGLIPASELIVFITTNIIEVNKS